MQTSWEGGRRKINGKRDLIEDTGSGREGGREGGRDTKDGTYLMQMAQDSSQPSFSRSMKILISSGMASAGWVSFSWMATWAQLSHTEQMMEN